MPQLVTSLADRRPPVPGDMGDLGRLTDSALVDAAAAAIAIPRERAADSFVLHAPLELLARAALLPMVEPSDRPIARERLRWLADTYSATGPGVDEVASPDFDFGDTGATLLALEVAIAGGDLDGADAAAVWLSRHLEAAELAAALADPVLPLLSAAAHGSIFLFQLPRVLPRSEAAALMTRGLVRELARYPGWDLSWFQGVQPAAAESSDDLEEELSERLRRPASPGDPGSDFIYPMMSLTESSGLAHDTLHDLVAAVPVPVARRALLRTAAMSMLQDDPSQSPYGWSHCLTMPQGALAMAEACATPWHAVAIAATYVLGFRSIHGRVELDPAWHPEHLGGDPLEALRGSPAQAAAAAWHAAPELRGAIRARLAGRAAAHHDAHLVKYTLACIDAAHSDPDAEHLYLAAAAHLGAWWDEAGRAQTSIA
ncbi:MAG: hypothetical protein ACOYXM_18600 [Actinomycetota bacterium]